MSLHRAHKIGRKEIAFVGSICIVFFVWALILCQVISWTIRRLRTQVDLSNSDRVAYAFFDSLMHNDMDLARSVVNVDLYPRIDEWNSTHRPFSCPVYWIFTNDDILEGDTGGGIGFCDEDSCNWYLSTECNRSNAIAYSFSIKDIELKRNGKKWMVISWGQICEQVVGEKTAICKK